MDNRYEFLKKLGVGFEHVFKVIDELEAVYFSEDYPPFNMVRTDSETWVVQVSMVGYEQKEISAEHVDHVLVIRAKSEKKPEEMDDIYFHQGIKDGDVYIKFLISPNLVHESTVFDSGMLYVTYKQRTPEDFPIEDGKLEVLDELTAQERALKATPHSGKVKFDRSGRPRIRKQRMGFRRYQYDNAGRPIAVLDLETEEVDKEETEALLKSLGKDKESAKKEAEKLAALKAKEEAEKKRIEEKAKKLAEEEAKVKAKSEAAKPAAPATPEKEITVEVEALENKPQIVEAEITKESDEKIKVKLKDATVEVSDDVEMKPVKTEKGKADIVVAVKKEELPILEETATDIVDTVAEVVEALDSAPELPEKTEKAEEKKTVLVDVDSNKPTVEVTVPKELPSVVKVEKDPKPTKKDVPALIVSESSEEISEEAELLPVITPTGNPDIVLAVEPELKKELEAEVIDVKEVVEEAVAKVVEEVKTSEPVSEEVVAEASLDPEVLVVEEKAAAEKVELVNKEEETKATVEVTDKTEDTSLVVEIKIDEEKTETVAEEIKPIVIEDATVEVSDEAELSLVKTEEGKADIIVAATPEVVDELTKANTTPVEIVEEVVKPAEPPAPIEEEKEEVVILVDKTDEAKPTVAVKVEDTIPTVIEATLSEVPVLEAPAIELKPAEDLSPDVIMEPVLTPDGQPDAVVAMTPEVKEAIKEAGVEEPVDVIEKALNQADVTVKPEEVDEMKVIEASEVEEVVEELEEIAKEPATIVVDANVEEKPTVEVTLAAEESPQVVAVKLDEKPTDTATPAIVVEDATIEVPEGTELIVAKTEEEKADVVIAIEPATKEALEEADVKVEEVVVKALETNDAVPEVPMVEPVDGIAAAPEEVTVLVDAKDEEKPTVEVTTEKVVPQVVVAEVDLDPANTEIVSVDLVDPADEIPTDAELIPVVTPEDQPDMVVALEPAAKEALESVNADPVEVLEKAVNIADVAVVSTESTTVKEEEVAEAAEPVAEKLEEIAKEPATLLINDDVKTDPTVEVTLAAEDAPQILEVKIDEAPSTDNPAIVLEDATVEVASDEVELLPVKTEEGKSDVVIAIEPEVKKELEAADVKIEEVVEKALDQNDATPELPPEMTAPVETVVIDELNVEVPEALPQIVEVDKDGANVSLSDASGDIPAEATIESVVTPEGSPDIMIATTEEVKAELIAENVEPAKLVEEAIAEVNPEIITVVEVPAEESPIEVEAAPAIEEPVLETAPKKPVVVVKKPTAE